MTINYESDFAYADAKLSDTIVTRNNIPILIYRVRGGGDVEYRSLGPNGIDGVCYIDDLDLSPVKLGNINFETGMTDYLARWPVRAWKQGLRLSSLWSARGPNHQTHININSSSLVNCILGIFPKLPVAVELLANNEVKSLAFSRNFALTTPSKKGLCKLLFKQKNVGVLDINKNFSAFTLDEKYSYLTEMLNDETNNAINF